MLSDCKWVDSGLVVVLDQNHKVLDQNPVVQGRYCLVLDRYWSILVVIPVDIGSDRG